MRHKTEKEIENSLLDPQRVDFNQKIITIFGKKSYCEIQTLFKTKVPSFYNMEFKFQ